MCQCLYICIYDGRYAGNSMHVCMCMHTYIHAYRLMYVGRQHNVMQYNVITLWQGKVW